MQLPALALNADILAQSPGIEIARRGREERRLLEDRNLLRAAGSQAATGNWLDAAQTAMRGGMLDVGLNLMKTKQAFDASDTERRLKLLDFFSRGAQAADTPEKWEALIGMAGQVYGDQLDVTPYRDFNMRPQVMGFLANTKEELERQKLAAEARKAEYMNVGDTLVRIGPEGATPVYMGPSGGAGKPPSGYRWSATQPGALEAIEGGPAARLPAETAGKVGMMRTSLQALPMIRNIFLGEESPDLGVDEKTGRPRRRGADFGLGIDYMLGRGELGEGYRLGVGAIESVLRAASGAAVPETEVQRYAGLFLPSYWDTEETKARKIDALERWIGNMLDAIQTGRPVDPGEVARISQAKQAGRLPREVAPPPNLTGPGQRSEIPPEAAQELLADPSAEAVREFDEIFGQGAAQSIIEAQ